jgi:3-oxoacyl-[acyl-carrier protein] reductase
MVSLEGRVAVVTGAGRGVGRAASLELARRGAHVALVARTESELQEVAHEIEALGRRSLVVVADVANESQVARMAERILAEFGTADILVNNAGIASRGSVESLTLEQWNRTLSINLTGVFLCCRAFIQPMKRQGRGHIVNVSSGAGRRGHLERAAYCATKFGVIGFSESLAEELTPLGIKVSSLVLGPVDTTFNGRLAHEMNPDMKLLQPEEAAEAILNLVTLSERAWTQEMNLWPFP